MAPFALDSGTASSSRNTDKKLALEHSQTTDRLVTDQYLARHLGSQEARADVQRLCRQIAGVRNSQQR